MKNRIIYSLLFLATLLSCNESPVDTIVPAIDEGEKTVSVTLLNIPSGSGGAPVFIFSLNSSGKVYALEGATAVESKVVKIAPPEGVAPFDIVAFIPDDTEWTTNKSFTSGKYSKATGQINRSTSFITISWSVATDAATAPSTGLRSALETVLFMNGSATPADTDFEESEIVTLDAVVSDNIKSNIATLSYRLDNTALKSYTVQPYKFQFNTKGVSLGSHMVYLRGTNARGDVAIDSIKIFISKTGNAGPSVSITGITNNVQIIRETVVNITATITDPDDGIDKVEFKINNALVGPPDRTAPYSYVWDTFDNSVGSLTVEVIAYDKAGQSRSDIRNVTLIDPANYAPRVSFGSPPDGATFTAGTTVSISVSATDKENNPINRVEFYRRLTTAASNTLIGQDTTSPYSIDFITSGLPAGDYFIFAVVYDNNGKSSYRNITITIN